jgi:hypothetical protein
MLAIVIPFYKKKYFNQTIASLANQTNKKFKVYIGNDASLDNIDDLLAQYSSILDIEYCYFDINLGSISLVEQWNRCLALVKNETWVTILGDDDCYDTNVVDQFYQNLPSIEAIKSNVVRFASQIIDQNSNIKTSPYTHPTIETAVDFINRKFTKKTRSSLSEHFFKREVLLEQGIVDFPLAWHSDDLAIITTAQNSCIYSINQANVLVRVSPESITGNKKNEIAKSNATQSFILNYITKYKNISASALNGLYTKLEIAYSINNNKTLRNKIIFFYIKKANIYRLLRFIYILTKK